MERARDFHFVKQFLRRTVPEVAFRDELYDKQVLLNETWVNYCRRKAYDADRVEEEHVKFVTETWEEYELRVVYRARALATYENLCQEQSEVDAAAEEQRRLHGKTVVALLNRQEDERVAKLTPTLHTLYVDFAESQRQKMATERAAIERLELSHRHNVAEAEEREERRALELQAAESSGRILSLLEAQKLRKEDDERKIVEEQRRKSEILRQKEEQSRRDAEAAEKLRKEREEEQKRQERKRREEERKSKAKSDREARVKGKMDDTKIDDDLALSILPPDDDPSRNVDDQRKSDVEQVAKEVENVEVPTKHHNFITFEPHDCSSIPSLFNHSTKGIRGNDSVYISKISCANGARSSLVVTHNGVSLNEPCNKDVDSHLVGFSLPSVSQALSLTSSMLHAVRSVSESTLEDYVRHRVEVIGNVALDQRCVRYSAVGTEPPPKEVETLVLIPIDCGSYSFAPYIVGFTRAGENSIHRDDIVDMTSYLLQYVAPRLREILRLRRLENLSDQALSWLQMTTGCDNVYLALTDTTLQGTQRTDVESKVLQYVAASNSQKWMIGKILSNNDEASGTVSFSLLNESFHSRQPALIHVPNICESDVHIRTFSVEKPIKGSLLACTLVAPGAINSTPLGVIYADTVNCASGKEFNKADEDILRTTAVLLAELISGNEQPQGEVAPQLAIEKDVSSDSDPVKDSPILFLKQVWFKVTSDISRITSGQLLEMSKYNSPPPIIPIVVAATLLVALGSQPKSVEKWDDARKKIKAALLEKIAVFDPTNPTRRKKAFFIRAAKVTKGFSAHDVFTKGSYPTSCFFTWTFVTILLRRTADKLRQSLNGGPLSVGAVPMEFLVDAPGDDVDDTVSTIATEDAPDASDHDDDDDG